jgi:ATP-binding cassette, subfamily B, bacterial
VDRALAYVGLTLLDGVASFLDDYLATWVGERFLLSLRTDFFAHLQRLSLDSSSADGSATCCRG